MFSNKYSIEFRYTIRDFDYGQEDDVRTYSRKAALLYVRSHRGMGEDVAVVSARSVGPRYPLAKLAQVEDALSRKAYSELR